MVLEVLSLQKSNNFEAVSALHVIAESAVPASKLYDTSRKIRRDELFYAIRSN
jgi:hypothetical protein